MDKMRMQLLVAYVGENIAGGFYLKLADLNKHLPELEDRFRSTAGDEIRHGEYFNKCYESVYGRKLFARKVLIKLGKVFGYPARWVPNDKLLPVIAKGEKAAVVALEKELATRPLNPYLEVVDRILPDERKHAEPYLLG